MGHHFSSIAGAGPITEPITAATTGFGWLACVLWILIASVAPVWILLQPRDYLSSFLLYAMLALAAIAAWLGNVGRKNAMCWIPMFFMLFVTLASLFIHTKTQFGLIAAGGADWSPGLRPSSASC